jgi:sugar phosphate permease
VRAVTDQVAPSGIGRYRWVVCSLLFFATTINYADRQILSLLKPILDVELRWTNEQFGVVNAAFQAAYAVGLLVFGAFVDRVGPRSDTRSRSPPGVWRRWGTRWSDR